MYDGLMYIVIYINIKTNYIKCQLLNYVNSKSSEIIRTKKKDC